MKYQLTKIAGGLALLVLVTINQSFSQDSKRSDYNWSAPGGQYVNPTSFFSMHGYVNAVFASSSADWTASNFNGIGMPGQVIVPNTNKSSFQNDEAIWLNSELDPKTSLLIELHLVTSPSGSGAAGPGGLTLVLTEALATWQLYENYLNVSFGTFWSPFGIQNRDWLGAQNAFSLIPLASGAYITHFNEKGIRVDGVLLDYKKWGINYVFGFGNGYNAWDISGYTSWDLNENKNFNGRISFFPGFGDKLELGISHGQGQLNKYSSITGSDFPNDHDQYMLAYGVDFSANFNRVTLRSYFISSEINYSNYESSFEKNNLGLLSEVSYLIPLKKVFKSVSPKLRYDYLQQQLSSPIMSDEYYTTVSAGLNFEINERFTIASDYNWLMEQNSLNNNRFIVRVSAEF